MSDNISVLSNLMLSLAARRVNSPRRIDREEVLEAGSSVEVSLTLFG